VMGEALKVTKSSPAEQAVAAPKHTPPKSVDEALGPPEGVKAALEKAVSTPAPAPAKPKAAPKVEAKPAPAAGAPKPKAAPAPAADEDDDGFGEEAQAAPAGEGDEIPAEVMSAGKLREVILALQAAGVATKADLVGWCARNKERVPALAKIADLDERVERAATLLGVE
jgi:hypothetical protein